MKVLHLIDSGGLYGAERMLLDLARQQGKAGVEASILSSTNDPLSTKPLVREARARGLNVIEWHMADGLNLSQARKIVEHAVDHGVDILHSHGYKFNILLGLLPRCIRRLPRICTVHGYLAAPLGSKAWWYQQLDRRLLARADATVFVSRAMLSQPAFRHLSVRHPQVIYNGLDFDQLQQSTASGSSVDVRQQYFADVADPARIRLFGAIGRLSAEKGYDNLLRVFAELLSSVPQARLLIAGEGPERHRLEALIAELGIGKQVSMPGFIDPVSPLFRQLDVLVMNSFTEGMPMTLLEAVAAGVPIVATRVGGIPEVLDGYQRSTLVAPGNNPQLQQALLEALSSDIAKQEIDVSGFSQRFSSATMEQHYRDLYAQVLGRG